MFKLTTKADVAAARADARRYKAQCEQHLCQPFIVKHYERVLRITEDMYTITHKKGTQK